MLAYRAIIKSKEELLNIGFAKFPIELEVNSKNQKRNFLVICGIRLTLGKKKMLPVPFIAPGAKIGL